MKVWTAKLTSKRPDEYLFTSINSAFICYSIWRNTIGAQDSKIPYSVFKKSFRVKNFFLKNSMINAETY